MDTIEFLDGRCLPSELPVLFEKYWLTPERYAVLLQGVYEAITGKRTLYLFTTRPEEERRTVGQEMLCCILNGILPSMRNKVTLSDGLASGVTINVIRRKIGLSGNALIFGVEDDQYTNIRSKDLLHSQMFGCLAGASWEQRKSDLERMDACLAKMGNLGDALPLRFIVAVYLYSCTALTPDTRLALFRTFGAAAGKTLEISVADRLITDLVREMAHEGNVGTEELSLIAEWYLAESSDEFHTIAEPLFKNAPVDVCLQMESAILKRTPITPNGRCLLCLLVQTVDPASPNFTDALRYDLTRWIEEDDVTELLSFCTAPLTGFDGRQMEKFVSAYLVKNDGKALNNVQSDIMRAAIQNLTKKKIPLSQENLAKLCRHISDYNDELTQPVLHYFWHTYVASCDNLEQAVDQLMKLGEMSPKMKPKIEATFITAKAPKLQECYLCRTLPEDVELDAIPGLCKTYNTFNNPGGPFEQAIYKRWIMGISKHIQACRTDISQMEEVAVRFLRESSRLGLSSMVINKARESIVRQFWMSITIESIVKHDRPLHYDIITVTSVVVHLDTEYRYRLMRICGQIKKRPEDTHMLTKLMCDMTPNHEDYASIKRCLPWLMDKILQDCHYLPLDLLLLRCADQNYKFDLDKMIEILKETQKMLDAARCPMPECPASTSAFLSENVELRRKIDRKLESGSYSKLPLFQAVLRGMKKKRPRDHSGNRLDFARFAAGSQGNLKQDQVESDGNQSNGRQKGQWRLFRGGKK